MSAVNIHASCVALGKGDAFGAPEDAGVLLLGKSGAGKSDLALRLIGRGAQLVADDRTDLFTEASVLSARAPEALAGLIEIRGVGIVALPHARQVRIALAVELVDMASVPRLPQAAFFAPPELSFAPAARPPLIRLCAFEASAPDKVLAAAAAFAKALFREHGNT